MVEKIKTELCKNAAANNQRYSDTQYVEAETSAREQFTAKVDFVYVFSSSVCIGSIANVEAMKQIGEISRFGIGRKARCIQAYLQIRSELQTTENTCQNAWKNRNREAYRKRNLNIRQIPGQQICFTDPENPADGIAWIVKDRQTQCTR